MKTIAFAVVDCGEPADMRNATMSYTGTTFEETVNYTCAVGFRFPNGAKRLMISCNDSGNWTGSNECEGWNICYFESKSKLYTIHLAIVESSRGMIVTCWFKALILAQLYLSTI